MTNILIFGDSITWGAWDKKEGWVQRLKAFVDEKNLKDENYDCYIYNLGVSGDTIEELLKRIEIETNARLGDSETIIIFAIGLNDSQTLKDKPRYSIEKFRNNLNELFKKAKKFSSKIIFVGLTPVDDSKVNPIPWAPEKSYKCEEVKRFNDEIKSFCEKENLYFIDVFNNFINIDYKGLLEDGAHPNTKGHEKLFLIIKDFLVDKNIV